MRLCKVALTVLAFIGFSGAAQATVIFSDNFDAEPGGSSLNYTGFANWNVSDGTVDLIAHGDYGIGCVGGSGKCVDLDGSTGNSGVLSTKTAFSLTPGNYLLSFNISGNQRDNNDDTVRVALGSAFSDSYTKNGADPFEAVMESFTVTSALNANLSFENAGGNNIGVILDSVALERQTVPEPTALALFGVGLAGIGFASRRRKIA